MKEHDGNIVPCEQVAHFQDGSKREDDG